uniref:U1740ae n=1 Tax=Mycobacterium leprae TaxID=1769 RepID=Q50089_MYCLR|nr:u1740ae [Mycobacterium leprae]
MTLLRTHHAEILRLWQGRFM